jgi:hypothetical protein
MATPSERAERLIQRLYKTATPQASEGFEEPKPPRSVISQLAALNQKRRRIKRGNNNASWWP